MTRSMVRFSLISIVLIVASFSRAETLSLSFHDHVGDQSGRSDLVWMSLTFDDQTGNYEILFIAKQEAPFSNEIRLNVNLLNPDTGFGLSHPSAFFRTCSTTSISPLGAVHRFLYREPPTI